MRKFSRWISPEVACIQFLKRDPMTTPDFYQSVYQIKKAIKIYLFSLAEQMERTITYCRCAQRYSVGRFIVATTILQFFH